MSTYTLERIAEKLNALNSIITDEDMVDGFEVASREIMDVCVNYVINSGKDIERDEFVGIINDNIHRLRIKSSKLMEDHEHLSEYYDHIADCMVQISKVFA